MPPRRCTIARQSSDMESDSEGDYENITMRCVSCEEEYDPEDGGTCMECYEEANETEEKHKLAMQDMKAKVDFLALLPPIHCSIGPSSADVVLVALGDDGSAAAGGSIVPVAAHKAVLVSRSPVFKAMLENDMEESRSGIIKISDVSYDALRAFVNYLYTAEANLDDQMAYSLLVLAEKYQVKHLKAYCETFLMGRLNWDKALADYAFAHLHNAQQLVDAALAVISGNMSMLSKHKDYEKLVESNPRLVVEIYETYIAKHIDTAFYGDIFSMQQ